jgi:hypothetical protein
MTPDDGQANGPKHVEFHFKNKFAKISASSWIYCKEICHDARSHEREIVHSFLEKHVTSNWCEWCIHVGS